MTGQVEGVAGAGGVVGGADLAGEEARRLIETAAAAFERLDVLVNNAGGIHRSPLASLSEADWDAMVDVNLKSAFLVTQAAEALLARMGSPMCLASSLIAAGVVRDARTRQSLGASFARRELGG